MKEGALSILLGLSGTQVASLIAEQTDPLSGGAGWLGAGLLGAVLAWLMLKHLPDKDKLLMTIIESRDRMLGDQRHQHSETIKSLGASINVAVEKVTSHCREELEAIARSLNTSPEKMEEAVARALTRALRERGSP